MQQIYAVKQIDKKVVHIEIDQPSRPPTSKTKSNFQKNFSKISHSPFARKVTRSTFYPLNDENNNSTISLNTTQRETDKKQHFKRRKKSAQTCYGSFTKSAIYSQIFTQPIEKMSKGEPKGTQRRSYSQTSELYDKINIFNQDLITKQYNLEQKHNHTPTKHRTIQSRNCSSINTQDGKLQPHKKPSNDLRVKPKPWQIKKKRFYMTYTTKKLKPENQKYSFRYCIDPWQIIDRDDHEY